MVLTTDVVCDAWTVNSSARIFVTLYLAAFGNQHHSPPPVRASSIMLLLDGGLAFYLSTSP